MEINGLPEGKDVSSPSPFALPHTSQNTFSQSSVMSSLGQGKGVVQWHSTDTCVESLDVSILGKTIKQAEFAPVQCNFSDKKALR